MSTENNAKQLKTILKSLPDPVFILSETGRYLSIFGGSDERHYHDGSKLVGLFFKDIMDKETAKWFQESVNVALNKKGIHVVEYSLKNTDIEGLEDKDGPHDEICFEGRIRALPDTYDGERAVLWAAHNITKRKVIERKLRELSEQDELTGLYNRRKLTIEIEKELQKNKAQPTIIMFDIDFLKQINDQFGHHVGDKVLCLIADESKKIMRKKDVLARIGGDEFMVLMKDTNKQQAHVIAQRLNKIIENTDFEAVGCSIKPTLSMGVTQANEQDDSLEKMFKRVDTALYKAKKGGRNQVVHA